MKMRTGKWEIRFMLCILIVIFMIVFASAQEGPYDKAIEAYAKKDFKTAVKYLQEYVEKKLDPYAYYLLGYANYKMKNYSEAMKYFREAYILDPDFSPTLFKTGIGEDCCD
ncbi:MAG: tetratricopeptide repeat protein [Nitrospirota bacterium]